jgi:hypothetical protein
MNAKTILTSFVLLLANAAPALAAPNRVDHSGLLVWAFLGLCAMIVVAQVAPAALMVLGLVKGLIQGKATQVVVE